MRLPYGLLVQFGVCAEDDKVDGIRSNLFIDRTEISSDIDAAISSIRAVERVIARERMGRALLKKPDSFVSSFSFRRPQFPVALTEIAVKNYFHGRW